MIYCEESSENTHGCTMNTIVSIESFILENSGKYTKTELWRNLPKKIMYQSYKVVIEFLIYSGKIKIKDKKVFWCKNKTPFNLDSCESKINAPTLNSINQVLKFAHENSDAYSKTQMWKALPKKIMYQTYNIILEYLTSTDLLKIENKKIIFSGGVK